MPTADNRPGNEAQLAITGPMERRASRDDDRPTFFERATTAAKRFAFPLVLLVMVVIVWITLSSIGTAAATIPNTTDKNPMGKIIFPTKAAPVLAWFGLVVMIYPAFKAVVRLVTKHTDQFELVRLGIAIGTTILGFWFIGGTLTTLQSLGVWLWGAKFPGVVALVCCALAAYLLTLYKEDNEKLAELERDLPGLEENVTKAKAEQAHQRNIVAQRATLLANLTSAYESLETTATEKSAAYIEARKRLDESDEVVKQAKLSTKLANAEKELGMLRTSIPALETQIEREKDPAEQAALQTDLDEKTARRTELRDTTIPNLKPRLEKLKEHIKTSPLKKAADKAKKESEDAAKKSMEAKGDLEEARQKHAAAEGDRNTASGVLTASETARNEVRQEIANFHAEHKSLWRDGVWVPVILPSALWVLALLGYTTWMGWMIVEFFV